METLIPILYMVILILIMLVIGLGLYYVLVLNRQRVDKKEDKTDIIASDDKNKEEKKVQNYGKFTGELTTESLWNLKKLLII